MSAAPPGLPDAAAIRAAAERISGAVHRTPVLTSRSLDELAGARLYFKCENLQRAGAFKLRGAANTVLSLPESEARRGVVTHSSGNHGAALALAAAGRGVPCWVVMPHDAPAVKRAAVAGYGAEIVYCEPTLESREAAAARLLADTGGTLVHPFDDPRVIAGQGTATLELLAEVPDLDRLVVPVGGGGLAAGTAIAAAAHDGAGAGRRPPRVTAAEPETVDDAARSLATGVRQPPVVPARTVADGLRTCLAERTFRALVDHRVEVVTVSEAAIVAALRTVFERLKLVIEPSAAVAVAAVLGGGAARPGERVGVILSGGNVDPERLAQLFAPTAPAAG